MVIYEIEFDRIKKELQRKMAKDHPDTIVNIKWQGRLKQSHTPTGIPIKWCKALVTGQGYNSREFTLIIDSHSWTFR